MMPATQIRTGMILKMNGELVRVAQMFHITPGRRKAFIHAKLKKLSTGTGFEYRFNSEEMVERIFLEQKEMEYIYHDGDSYYFMNTETYEQIPISKDILDEGINYLLPNMKVQINFHDGKALAVQMPMTVDLRVTTTDPGLKSATAQAKPKPATLETGITIQVPQFVKEGDVIKVDTQTGEYIERTSY